MKDLLEKRAEEFSLIITYRKPDQGSYPRVEVEGFYLVAYFCNGAQRFDYAGDVNGVRLSDKELLDILQGIQYDVKSVGPWLAKDVKGTLASKRRDREQALKALEQQQQENASRIALLRASLSEAEQP